MVAGLHLIPVNQIVPERVRIVRIVEEGISGESDSRSVYGREHCHLVIDRGDGVLFPDTLRSYFTFFV